MFKKLSMAAFAVALSASSSLAATEVTWWHAMGGELGKKLEEVAQKFNESQSDYKVVPVFKGTYPETLTAAIAAFRANQQPAIVQVFEVGTGTMMAAKGAVYPVYKLMSDNKEPWDPKGFLAPVVGYYSDAEGNILSMPFNSSTPIMYYNKDVFQKAGLDPEVAPKTWAELAEMGKKIVDSGAAQCGFTLSYAATWVGLENYSAIQNLPFGTLQNGFGGLETEFKFNGKEQAAFWDNLKKWQDAKIFKYGGPGGGAETAPSFYSQQCAVYMGSSASRAGVINNAKNFKVGFAPMPYDDTVTKEPKNSIIGGATLWTLNGQKNPDVYKGVAKFFTYLSKPEVQADWHQFTGYLPITNAAYELGQKQGYYEKNPGSDIAIKQITRGTPTDNSKGVRFGNLTQIRDLVDQQFETVLSGKKTGQQALDDAAKAGNAILREFEAANSN
ncbi:sn-glycerol-3-phosphate ABC transporter substrate-binding protein UgpB [Neorhizobium sp. DT-125]|uniref:sn-glycerol-3-phosphate ABC transporter substrate-binding protein UgpB n=1 Tax=Neorhizobium sp. DT-125 TaxID=3396163 RepID=UPI003F1C3FE2